MIRALVANAALSLALLAAAPSGAAAQWAVSAEISAARFWGGSAEGSGDRAFRPYRPTLIGLGVERWGRRMGIGVRAYHASSALALEGDDAVVAVNGALELYGAAAEVSVGLGRIGGNVQLRFRAGPVLESWKPSGESAVVRAGFGGSAGLQVPLGGRWAGIIGAGATITGSPFSAGDLGAGFHPRALWRREMRGTLQYRL